MSDGERIGCYAPDMFGLHSGIRAFAALLLLVGVILGGAVDAAACEPELQSTSFVEAHDAHQGQDAPEQGTGDHDGACVHGHCHHGAQSFVKGQDVTSVIFMAIAPTAVDQTSLVSIAGNTPKRPPRA